MSNNNYTKVSTRIKSLSINLSNHKETTRLLKIFVVILLSIFSGVSSIFATTYYQRQSGNWNSATTWTTSNAWAASVNTGTYPQAGDDVHLANNGNTATITLTGNATCANLYFDGSEPACFIAMGNYNLVVTGNWTTGWSSNSTITQGTGYLQINGNIPMFRTGLTIANFRVGSSTFSFTQTNTTTLTVTSNYDYNCFQTTIPTGINANSATKYNASPCSSTLSATTLTSFGSICPNTSAGPNSFTISGLSLTNANVTVGSLNGFTFSTTAGGSYSSSLSLTQAGGNYSQVVYVKFNPIAAVSYNGNIVIGGGGAANINVASIGSGSNSVSPIVTSPTVSNIMATTATLGGNITIEGCSSQSIIERGIYYSTTSGFADGTGTKVSETGTYGTGVFSLNVTGLSTNTTYYYKAFATNSNGTGYSTQGAFNNSPKTYYSRQSGNWTDPSTWSTESKTSIVNVGTYPTPNDIVYINQISTGHIITVDAAGLSCNNLFMTDYTAQLIVNYNFTINGILSLSNHSKISVGANTLTINGDYSAVGDNNTYISWTSGNIIFNGNLTFSNTGSNSIGLNCTGLGWLIMNGTSKTFTTNNDLTIPNFRLGSSSITKAGTSKLTISSSFDLNNQTSFAQSAGTIDLTGTVANYGLMTMAYTGTPTFTYSGGGNIVGGNYYNLITQTKDISIACGTTVSSNGAFTNSKSITGPTTAGSYARVVNANTVANTGNIGASSSYIAFSKTISGGTVGANVLQTSSQLASCYTASTIATGTITGSPFCAGSTVSVPYTVVGNFNSGNIFTAQLSNSAGSFTSPVTIGTLISTSAGTITATIPTNTGTGTSYRIRVISSNPAITGDNNGINLTINAFPATPTTTGAQICIGTTNGTTLSASGAASGEQYKWYNASSDGTLLKTSTNNTDNTYTTATITATTNYWVSIINAGGCESARAQVTATYTSVSSDDQNTAGTNSWIGHVYDGINFNSYYGSYNEPKLFDQNFGGSTTCFPITSNSISRSIYTESFSVRYRMNSTQKGLFAFDLGSDDGSRLIVDGTTVYNNWIYQGFTTKSSVLMSFTGSSTLTYEYFESGSNNRVAFGNEVQIIANTLTTNINQHLNPNSSGSSISGDVFGTLPSGITLSGTGYQWTYSTSPTGIRTTILGATGATYTPNSSAAPFNTVGTYYIFRNAILSSTNNVSPNPYMATNESNYATLIVNNDPLITVSTSTLNELNYAQGYGPSAQQFFTVSGANLTDNITISPSANYEISTTSGNGFQSTPLMLTQSGGSVSSKTIYVRLKAGLTIGNYNYQNISCTSSGTDTKNVTCSGSVYLPLITVTTTALDGFTYAEGFGPSTQLKSFNVSGNSLTTNITILPTDTFEISLTSGVNFVAQSLITLDVIDNTVSSTTIYVRMKAGLGVGNINPNTKIKCSSDNAVTKTVNCSGTVSNAPTIILNPSTLNGFSYNITNGGPSAIQLLTITGAYLTSNLIITAPSNYEIRENGVGAFTSTLSFPQSSGVVNKTIELRLKSGLAGGAYNQNITFESTNVTKSLLCQGSVNAPYIAVSTFSLGGFIYTAGAGPSGVQTFTVNGANMTHNLILTAPANFEIKESSSGNFENSINIAFGSGTVSPTSIDVRMKAGLSSETVLNPANLVASTIGAIQQNVALSGKVVSTSTNITSNASLTGFVYTLGNGPSVIQSFTVSGTSLTNNITITPPSNYEICLTQNGAYVETPISITPNAGSVNAQTIFVRLKTGLAIGTYGTASTPVNINIASIGASSIIVSINGQVIAVPTITAGITPDSPVCNGTTVSLTSAGSITGNLFWTGPNGYSSTLANPSLGVVSTTNSGNYTVTGTAVSGVNLLTNGSFEDGNTGFVSSYIYHTYGLINYGQNTYTVGPNPKTKNPAFCDQSGGQAGINQMIIDGATSSSGGPGTVVWSESIAVVPGANYQFSYWLQSLHMSHPAILQLHMNGIPIGSPNNATTTTCIWKEFVNLINTGSNSNVQLALIDLTLDPSGNDFAIDNLIFQQVFTATSTVNLTVNPILPVSVSIAASANTVTQGSTVTYTATPTNGGTTPSYQWKVNGVNKGTNSSTYSYAPNQGDIVTCVLTSSLLCTTGNPATSNTITMTVNIATNYWHGTYSTDWGTPANWTNNKIPSAGNDVIYATTANNNGSAAINDLYVDDSRTIGSLINLTDKKLVIPAGKSLIVNNSITVTPPTKDPIDLILIEAAANTANGSLSFKNAQNNPVYGSVQFYSKSSWDKSQPINQRYNWQYFGIPVDGITASPTFDGGYVRQRDEAGTDTTTHWSQLSDNSNMIPFKGYELCFQNPKTTLIRGKLINRDFKSGTLVKTASSGVLYPGQHVLANSYTTGVNIKLIRFGPSMEKTVYLYHTGSFGAWSSSTGDKTGTSFGQYFAVPQVLAGLINLGMPSHVPSMSSMLVRVITANDSAYVNLTYNNVIMRNTEVNKIKNESTEEILTCSSTKIEVEGEYGSDKMWIVANETFNQSFDNGGDGYKFAGNALSPQIYAVTEAGKLQVNATNDLNNTVIAFSAGQDTQYQMKFIHENTEEHYSRIFLHDLVAKQVVDITENGSIYNFEASSTPAPVERFLLVSQPANLLPVSDENRINVFSAHNNIYVYNLSDLPAKAYLFDAAGRQLSQANLSAKGVAGLTGQQHTVLLLKVVFGDKTITQKIVVN